MSTALDNVGRGQGDGSSKDAGMGLSLALGAKASGRLFEEAHKAEFNPVKESALKLEAADLPNINAKTVFSQNKSAESGPPPQQNSAEVAKILGTASIAGSVVKSDTNYSAAAVMAADQKVFGKKSNAA